VAPNESGTQLLRRSENVDETRVGDRVVLYQRDTGSGIVLNPSGSRIWDQLKTPMTPEQLIDALATAHSTIAREKIASDVDAYVTALREQRLLEE
jgi:hypothetical protein